MEIVYHIVNTDSVLLLNGGFVQSAPVVRYDSDEPLYITVLPLSAVYIPYTVSLLGGTPRANAPLVLSASLGDGHYYAELLPRHAYVYSPVQTQQKAPANLPERLLSFVQNQNFDAARALLTPSLSDSLSNDALADFFENVCAIRENKFTEKGGWLLLKQNAAADLCNITFLNQQIDNIKTE